MMSVFPLPKQVKQHLYLFPTAATFSGPSFSASVNDSTMSAAIICKKMQLDVGVSPPANIMTFRPGLTYLTLDLDPRDL